MKKGRPAAKSEAQRDAGAGHGSARGAVKRPARAATPAAQLVDILEMVSDGFVTFDAGMNYTYVNERAAKLLGRPAQDLIGKNYWQEYPEAKGTPFAAAYQRALETQTAVEFEHHFAPWDRWFENRVYPSTTGLAVFFTEVTARKRVEMELQASQLRLARERDFSNSILDCLPGVFFLKGQSNEYLRWNKNLEKVTGYSADEIARLSPLDLIAGPDRPLVSAAIDRVFTEGSAEVEADIQAKDGTVTPYYLTALRTQLAGQSCMIGVGWDISERRRVEAAVADSERRLALIFATVSDIIFLLAVEPDERYRFATVNPAFLTVTGLRREQVVGKRVEEVLPETAHAFVLERYRQAIRDNTTVHWEEASAYPTGMKFGDVAVTPALDAAGVCTHLIGSVHDTTELRRAADQIRELNLELEQRVVERTAQLEAANKELEAFSYSVSHDLRAPLRAISGFAEIIARRHRDGLADEARHYFDNIVQASARMGHLIDALLRYSRLGHRAVRRHAVPLPDLFAALAAGLAPRLEPHGGRLAVAADLPAVIGDETLLVQVFGNLLDNAVIYRRADRPLAIDVSCQRAGGEVIIRVADNGIGIAPEFHDKIFHMFQRLHSEEDYPGTGIGLATVKRSLELLGGGIWVESAPGAGSIFCVRLRAA